MKMYIWGNKICFTRYLEECGRSDMGRKCVENSHRKEREMIEWFCEDEQGSLTSLYGDFYN